MTFYPFIHFIGQKDFIANWIFKKIDFSYEFVLDLFGGSGLISSGFRCRWIDTVISNILNNDFKSNVKGLLFFALSQACLRKQPFNTFHGSFINLRLKKRASPQAWDKSLEDVFIETISDVNKYLETIEIETEMISTFTIPVSEAKPSDFSDDNIDLLYLDPPFIGGKKRISRLGNYFINYHVLEALANYPNFSEWIDLSHSLKFPKNDHPIMKEFDKWLNKDNFLKNFEKLIARFQDSKLVLSYRDDSVITVEELLDILGLYKSNLKVFKEPHLYKDSKKKAKFNDLLVLSD
jgi:adenine-specific DNA-methyltransferase